MTTKKSAFWTLLFYSLTLVSPSLTSLLHLSKSQTIYFTIFTYIFGAAILIFIAYKTKERNLIETGKNLPLYSIITTGFIGIFVIFIAQITASLIDIYIFKNAMISPNTAYFTEITKKFPFFIWVVSLAGPIMEELFFRKALIGFLSPYTGIWIGAIISSALFSLAHGDKRYLTYFIMGFIFFLLYKKTGNILTSIITHCSMNLLVILIQQTL